MKSNTSLITSLSMSLCITSLLICCYKSVYYESDCKPLSRQASVSVLCSHMIWRGVDEMNRLALLAMVI